MVRLLSPRVRWIESFNRISLARLQPRGWRKCAAPNASPQGREIWTDENWKSQATAEWVFAQSSFKANSLRARYLLEQSLKQDLYIHELQAEELQTCSSFQLLLMKTQSQMSNNSWAEGSTSCKCSRIPPLPPAVIAHNFQMLDNLTSVQTHVCVNAHWIDLD